MELEMNALGLDWWLLTLQLINLVLVITYGWLVILALTRLVKAGKTLALYFLWALVIVVVPFGGALLFILEHPKMRTVISD